MISWFILSIFFLYEFFLRSFTGTLKLQIIESLQITNSDFVFLNITTYMISFAIFQLFAGFIIKKFGVNRSAFVSCLICAMSCIIFSYSSSLYQAMFARSLMGVGSSFAYVCIIAIIMQYFPMNRTSIYIGLSQLIGTIGPSLATGPAYQISTKYNLKWDNMLFIVGVCGVILSLIILAFVSERKNTNHNYIFVNPNKNQIDIKKLIIGYVKNKQFLALALCSGLLFMVIETMSDSEGVEILIHKGLYGESLMYPLTLMWFSYAITGPIIGNLVNITGRITPILRSVGALYIFANILLMLTHQKPLIYLSFILIGAVSGGQGVMFSAISSYSEPDQIPVYAAFTNAITMFVIAVLSPIANYLFDVAVFGNVRGIYIFFTSISLLFMYVCSICLKETYLKHQNRMNIVSLTN